MEAGKSVQQEIPSWASAYVSDSSREIIERTILAAEKQTRLEIVLMFARQSSFTGHVFFLLFTLLFVGVFLLMSLAYEFSFHDFQSHWSAVIAFIFASLVSWPLAQQNWFKRLLSPLQDELRAVSEKAELQFYRSEFHKTKGSTGVLIYVSLMERRATILADREISQFVSADFWQKPLDAVLEGFRKGAVDKGVQTAIQDIATLGAKHYPAEAENPDELCNRLRFVE